MLTGPVHQRTVEIPEPNWNNVAVGQDTQYPDWESKS